MGKLHDACELWLVTRTNFQLLTWFLLFWANHTSNSDVMAEWNVSWVASLTPPSIFATLIGNRTHISFAVIVLLIFSLNKSLWDRIRLFLTIFYCQAVYLLRHNYREKKEDVKDDTLLKLSIAREQDSFSSAKPQRRTTIKIMIEVLFSTNSSLHSARNLA